MLENWIYVQFLSTTFTCSTINGIWLYNFGNNWSFFSFHSNKTTRHIKVNIKTQFSFICLPEIKVVRHFSATCMQAWAFHWLYIPRRRFLQWPHGCHLYFDSSSVELQQFTKQRCTFSACSTHVYHMQSRDKKGFMIKLIFQRLLQTLGGSSVGTFRIKHPTSCPTLNVLFLQPMWLFFPSLKQNEQNYHEPQGKINCSSSEIAILHFFQKKSPTTTL